MFKTINQISLVVLAIVILAGCGNKNKATQPPPDIPVFEAIQKDIPLTREFVGEVYGIADIPIRTRVEGWLENISFVEGGLVKKGQVLYKIDPEPMETQVAAARSRLAEAQTMLAKAKNDYNRYKPLAEINAVSQSDLDWAKAQYEAAQASVDAAQASLDLANIRLGYTVITSPINGIIGKTQARVGEFVGKAPNAVILNTVSRIDTVRVEFFITEANYLQLAREYLKENDSLRSEQEQAGEGSRNLSLILSDGSVYDHTGKVNFIDREVNEQSGAFLVQASFPNPLGLLRPGQFARVVVPVEVAKGAVLIPQRCVMELQGVHQVYVVGSEGIIETRQIEVGPTYKNMWIVLKGLKPGDKVVLEGLQKVKAEMKVNPVVTDFSEPEQNSKQ